ncbi:MAG: DUF4838 domain-containing protein [Planctomycetes bacterium]|nr:DUF4838 domain-containing protein [Planctomycetota bacterium]
MAEIRLVEGGQSKYSILVAEDAPRPIRFAAQELQRYVQEISGAALPITSEGDGNPAILVCTNDDSAPALHDRGEDAYAMRTDGDQIVLAGNSPHACVYVVYHFLEKHLGCGWCAPGEDTVPKQATIRLSPFHDVIGPPAFAMRQIILFPYGGEWLVMNNMLHTDWMAKNRLNWAHPAPNAPRVWEHNRSDLIFTPEVTKRGLRLEVGGHAFNIWVPNDRYADHPEYFAQIEDGSRTTDGSHEAGLCISNPDVAEVVAENMTQWLDANPEVDAVDLWHNDSHTYCLCPDCTPPGLPEDEAKMAYTRTYIRFVNEVTERVVRKHPDVLVNLLAYFHTMVLPDNAEPLHDNVLVGLCLFPRPGQRTMRPIETSDQHRDVAFRKQLVRWPEVAKNFYVYEYYTVGERYKLWSMVSMICEDMRYFHRLGITGISSDQWGPGWYPLNMYAYGKLAWNPNLTPEEIIADFCTRTYDGAADAMMDYWNLLEEGLRESWTTQDPINWRDDQRREVIRKALSQAGDDQVDKRIRDAAALHQLAGL